MKVLGVELAAAPARAEPAERTLVLLDALREQPLESVLEGITPYPQVLLNVRVREKPDLHGHQHIGPVVREIEAALDGDGRLVLRYSGTEPVTRVMLEGRDEEVVRRHAERLAGVIRDEIGA